MKSLKKFLSGALATTSIFTCCKDAVFGIRTMYIGQGTPTVSHIAQRVRNEYGMSIHDLTGKILEFNGLSWERAKYLQNGTPTTLAEVL